MVKCNDRKLREGRRKGYKKQKGKKGLIGTSSSGKDTVTPIINSMELCLPTLNLQKSEPVSSYPWVGDGERSNAQSMCPT